MNEIKEFVKNMENGQIKTYVTFIPWFKFCSLEIGLEYYCAVIDEDRPIKNAIVEQIKTLYFPDSI